MINLKWKLSIIGLLFVIIVTGQEQFSNRFQVTNESGKVFNLINITDLFYVECLETDHSFYSNQNTYITPQLRYDLCRLSYMEAKKSYEGKFIPECFVDEGHPSSNFNPCEMVCDSKTCENLPSNQNRFALTKIRCGHQHICDSNGCCVYDPTISTTSKPETTDPITTETPTTKPTTSKPETTDPITTETPTTKPTTFKPETTDPITTETPTTKPTTSKPETTDPITTETPTTKPTTSKPETTDPITTETPTTKPTTSKPETTDPITTETPTTKPTTSKPDKDYYECTVPGYFANIWNPRFYYHCKYFATVHTCSPNGIYDIQTGTCIFDPKMDDPSLKFETWRDFIKCNQIGTFKSPYNCKYYYTCIPNPNGKEFFIYFNYCIGDLVFNDTIKRCDYKRRRCNNRLTLP
ncbi:hypothetical protein RDWZM_007412 [Blomia tropicalis]|uniref:Chitin-binding type-2 domain-containing protein n=1 Tax=Blomia tropicalis TaxID=40697 RepID=A0A9Q0LZ44_BLOTA|nr:hypothetical protein RDWZM_007412 [Blomia tropicalis]